MSVLDIGGTIEYCEECEASHNAGTPCDCDSYVVRNWPGPRGSWIDSGPATKLRAPSFLAAAAAFVEDTNCWVDGKEVEVFHLKPWMDSFVCKRFAVHEGNVVHAPVDIDYYLDRPSPEMYV